MSQENVERFHHALRQWYERQQIGSDLLAEDVEWVNPHNALERGTRRGIGGFNQGIARVADAWVDVRFETERVIDCGEDVVALGVVRGQSRGTGIDLERPRRDLDLSRWKGDSAPLVLTRDIPRTRRLVRVA